MYIEKYVDDELKSSNVFANGVLQESKLTEAPDEIDAQYLVKYWEDEILRDQGVADYYGRYSDLDEAKDVCDWLVKKGYAVSAEVVDKYDSTLYGSYPEDESFKEDMNINKSIKGLKKKVIENKLQESKDYHKYKTQLEQAKTKDELTKIWSAFRKDYDSEMTPNEEKTLGELYKDLRKELTEN